MKFNINFLDNYYDENEKEVIFLFNLMNKAKDKIFQILSKYNIPYIDEKFLNLNMNKEK